MAPLGATASDGVSDEAPRSFAVWSFSITSSPALLVVHAPSEVTTLSRQSTNACTTCRSCRSPRLSCGTTLLPVARGRRSSALFCKNAARWISMQPAPATASGFSASTANRFRAVSTLYESSSNANLSDAASRIVETGLVRLAEAADEGDEAALESSRWRRMYCFPQTSWVVMSDRKPKDVFSTSATCQSPSTAAPLS